MGAAVKKMLRWPATARFPALDLVRLLLLHGSAADCLGPTTIQCLLDSTAGVPCPMPTCLMALRALCILFHQASASALLLPPAGPGLSTLACEGRCFYSPK